MSESDLTTVQRNNSELLYYEELEKYIGSLSEKFRKKCVIKRNVYHDIVRCLLLPKGKPSGLFSAKFIYWVKHHFMLIQIAGVELGCCIKSKKKHLCL